MKGLSFSIVVCLSLFYIPNIWPQQVIDARGAGMAFSNSADTRGLEQVGLNPATLALKHRYNFELNLLSVNLTANSNWLNKGLYDQYFTSGTTLNNRDKNEILNSIPASGPRASVSGKVNTFAVYMPRFSLSFVGMGNGYYNLPKEIVELALLGNNDLDRVYDLSNIEGFGWGGGAVMLSLAFPAKFLRNRFMDKVALGITAKYISGLRYFEVVNAQGNLYNIGFENSSLFLEETIELRMAAGGRGFGYDVGFVAQSGKKWNFSLAILNATGNIKWNRGAEGAYYIINTDSLSISSNGINDSSIVHQDSTFAISKFSTRLPAVLDFGVAYRVSKKLLLTSEYERGLNDSMGGFKQSRLALGMEFSGLTFLPIRGGISLGGSNGFSSAIGVGLNLNYWFIDVGFINHGGLKFSQLKGVTLAATTRIRF